MICLCIFFRFEKIFENWVYRPAHSTGSYPLLHISPFRRSSTLQSFGTFPSRLSGSWEASNIGDYCWCHLFSWVGLQICWILYWTVVKYTWRRREYLEISVPNTQHDPAVFSPNMCAGSRKWLLQVAPDFWCGQGIIRDTGWNSWPYLPARLQQTHFHLFDQCGHERNPRHYVQTFEGWERKEELEF